MKRILIVILCLVLTMATAVSLSACGSGSNEPEKSSGAESAVSSAEVIEDDEDDIDEEDAEDEDSDIEDDEDDEDAEDDDEDAASDADDEKATPAATSEDAEWSELIAESEDIDGHKFELTYKLSPWMLLSANKDKLEEFWDEVGGENDLPGFDDWGLKDNDPAFERKINKVKFSHAMNDMYYCIGTVSIKNLTDNMPITKSDKASAPLYFVLNISPETGTPKVSKADAIFRFYRPKNVIEDSFSLETEIKMSKDAYGPLPFIIMVPEVLYEDHPEGVNLDSVLKSYFKYDGGQGRFQVSTIDKDGKLNGPVYSE
ncbi:MAG: hypothetical protein IIY88_06085 [Eubacterium sp.]|nr:hypothetical protein [Eubacterium sp.]